MQAMWCPYKTDNTLGRRGNPSLHLPTPHSGITKPGTAVGAIPPSQSEKGAFTVHECTCAAGGDPGTPFPARPRRAQVFALVANPVNAPFRICHEAVPTRR